MRIRSKASVSAKTINCKKTTDWKTALESYLQDGAEVSLVNFDCTEDNTSHCKEVAESHSMVLRTNPETAAAHFFRSSTQ